MIRKINEREYYILGNSRKLMDAKFNGFTVVKTRLGITNCRKFMQNLQFLPVLLAYFEHFKHSFFHFILEIHHGIMAGVYILPYTTPLRGGIEEIILKRGKTQKWKIFAF